MQFCERFVCLRGLGPRLREHHARVLDLFGEAREGSAVRHEVGLLTDLGKAVPEQRYLRTDVLGLLAHVAHLRPDELVVAGVELGGLIQLYEF